MILSWDEYCALDQIDPLVDIEDQAQIQLLIDAAQATIENTTNRLFEVDDREIETVARSAIILPAYPITTFQVFQDEAQLYGPETEITSQTFMDKAGGILYFRNPTCNPFTPIKITWNGGLATIPGDLKLALYKIVKWNQKRTNNSGVRSIQSDQATTTFETTIPADVRQTLDFYKRGI